MDTVQCISNMSDVERAMVITTYVLAVAHCGTLVKRRVAEAFDYADTVTNLDKLADAFQAVEQQLKDAEQDPLIQAHLPTILVRCKERLWNVQEALFDLQEKSKGTSRLIHILSLRSDVATGIREQQRLLSGIELDIKRSSLRARYLAHGQAAPLSPLEQIAEVQALQPATLPTRQELQGLIPFPNLVNPFTQWRRRLSSLMAAAAGSGMADDIGAGPVLPTHVTSVPMGTFQSSSPLAIEAGLDSGARSEDVVALRSSWEIGTVRSDSTELVSSRAVYREVDDHLQRLEKSYTI